MVRLISENSTEQLQAKRAEQVRQDALALVGWRLKDLTANLLRVVRGAGKPWEVGSQAQALVESMIQYRETVGVYPASEEISAALDIERSEEFLNHLNGENRRREALEQMMLRGALQVVASRLLDQSTQAAKGHHELFDGVMGWHRINEEVNANLKMKTPRRRKKISL